jgi:hypothetical protein
VAEQPAVHYFSFSHPAICMKTLLTIASSLALAALLLPAQAQTPATTPDNPTPAKPTAKPSTQRGTAHKQSMSASTKETVGRKFIEKSKPTGSPNQPRTPIQ